MKTLVKALCILVLTAVLLSTTVSVTFASGTNKAQTAPEIPFSFNKMVISGNITVVISQSSKEGIIVEGDFNRSELSITRKNYTLKIISTSTDPLTVKISVKDLQRIDASGNACVKTSGKLNVKYLQVFLRNNAKADIAANTESLYTLTTDNTNLKLAGSTEDYTVIKDAVSKLTLQDFIAAKSTVDSVSSEMLAALKIR